MLKRVALISEHASPLARVGGVDAGGQNIYVAQLAKHLALLGYEVDVFTRRDHPLLPQIADWIDRVRIIHVPAGPARYVRKEDLLPLMDDFAAWTLDFCRRERPGYGILHANFFMSGLVALRLKEALNIPFVITFHALGRVRRQHQREADEFPEERLAIEELLVREADRLIAECPQDRQDLLHLYQAEAGKIRVVPCGYDPAEFWPIGKSLARAAIGLAPAERVILQLGRLVPRKGIDNVVRAVSRLIHRHRIRARLLVVGGETDRADARATPEIGRLQRLASDEGIAAQVTFTGGRDREALKSYYSAADLFVTTPWYEPFGITPLEAMACGTPVLASAVGGLKFTVRHGENGFLVPPRDPEALADRMAELYLDPPLMQTLRRQAVDYVTRHFTWEKVAGAMAQLYEDTLSSHWRRNVHFVDHLTMIDDRFHRAAEALQRARQRLRLAVLSAADLLAACVAGGGKLLFCGDGLRVAGGAHYAAEFLSGLGDVQRLSLPVRALKSDKIFFSQWSRETGYAQLLAREVAAIGRPGDALIALSASGHSHHLVPAFEAARQKGLRTVALMGEDRHGLLPLADAALQVPLSPPPRVQEVQHITLHLLADMVRHRLELYQPLRGRAPAGEPRADATRPHWLCERRQAGRSEDSALDSLLAERPFG